MNLFWSIPCSTRTTWQSSCFFMPRGDRALSMVRDGMVRLVFGWLVVGRRRNTAQRTNRKVMMFGRTRSWMAMLWALWVLVEEGRSYDHWEVAAAAMEEKKFAIKIQQDGSEPHTQSVNLEQVHFLEDWGAALEEHHSNGLQGRSCCLTIKLSQLEHSQSSAHFKCCIARKPPGRIEMVEDAHRMYPAANINRVWLSLMGCMNKILENCGIVIIERFPTWARPNWRRNVVSLEFSRSSTKRKSSTVVTRILILSFSILSQRKISHAAGPWQNKKPGNFSSLWCHAERGGHRWWRMTSWSGRQKESFSKMKTSNGQVMAEKKKKQKRQSRRRGCWTWRSVGNTICCVEIVVCEPLWQSASRGICLLSLFSCLS